MKIVMAEQLALSLTHADLLGRGAEQTYFGRKEDIIFRCFF